MWACMIATQQQALFGDEAPHDGALAAVRKPDTGNNSRLPLNMRAPLVACLVGPVLALLSGETPALGGTNVIITADDVIYEQSDSLPYLKPETRITSYGAVANDAFDGIITIGATLSLDPVNKFYSYGKAVRRSLQMFLDMVNYDFGGLNVSGQRYGMRFTWVGDGGNSKQVANATAHASRLTDADFIFAGYASGYTTHAVKQSYAEGKLIMCGGAATPSVYSQNNLSFGFFPPGGTYTKNAILAIADKAEALDANGTTNCGLEVAAGESPRSCVESIRVGFLQAQASFTTTMCAGAPEHVYNANLTVVLDETDGSPLTVTVPSTPTAEEMETALARLKAANVTVIVGCTYYATGVAMLTGLEALDYSPLATTMSSTLDTDNFAAAVAEGWWQGEYAIGYATWHRSSTTRGAFSGMTSEEFASAFEARYDDVAVPYQGASQFAAAVALADAIQKAGTLDTQAVAAQLRVQDLTEFYGQLSYDEHGQIQGDMVVLQWLPDGPTDSTDGGSGLGLIYPMRLATGDIAFPTPPWALRRCRALSVDDMGRECQGRGVCTADGTCACDSSYGGDYCETRLSGVPVVRIGGLFPFHSTADASSADVSGLARVASFLLAIAEINDKSDGVADDLLPNTRIEVALADSRRDADVAQQAALSLLQGFGGEGVSAIVGACRSDASASAALLTAPNLVPQISPASTSASLSAGTNYFARTPPSDDFQAVAMAELLLNLFNASRVAVVATTDGYGAALLEAFRTEASSQGIDILTAQTFEAGTAPGAEVFNMLRRAAARYYVLLCSATDGAAVLQVARSYGLIGDGYVWLGSDAVSGPALASHLAAGTASDILPGYFWLIPNSGAGSAEHTAFLDRLNSTLPVPIAQGNGTAPCSTATDDEGNLIWAYGAPGEPADCLWPSAERAAVDSYSAYTYDATYAVIHALHELIEGQGVLSIEGSALMQALVGDVAFEGLTGFVDFFDNSIDSNLLYHGDRRTGVVYDVFNVQSGGGGSDVDGSGEVVGSWTPATCNYCSEEARWQLAWNESGVALRMYDGSSDPPDSHALPLCSSRDAVAACVRGSDARAVHFGWLTPQMCDGEQATPADGTAAQDACQPSSDPSVSGEVFSPLVFSFTLHYESGETVSLARAPTLRLFDGDGALLLDEVDCGAPLSSEDTTQACTLSLAHLGALNVGVTARDAYFQAYTLGDMLSISSSCPAHQVPSLTAEHVCECEAGYEPGIAENDGTTLCTPCAPGSYKATQGGANCERCGQGTYSKDGASVECTLCAPLTYQPAIGSTGCRLCEAKLNSSYGASSCDSCRNTYYLDSEGACQLCADLPGADPNCPANTDVGSIRLLPGYWRLSNATTDIRECESSSSCLGGADAFDSQGSGYCAAASDGPLCKRCKEENAYFSTRDAQCEACPSSADAFGRIIALLFALMVLLLIMGSYQQLSRELLRRGASAMVRMIISLTWLTQAIQNLHLGAKFKLLISFCQVFSMVPAVYEVDLPDQYQSFFDFFDVFMFDIDLLLPGACVSQDPSTILTAYSIAPLLLIAGILLLGVAYVSFKKRQLRNAETEYAAAANTSFVSCVRSTKECESSSGGDATEEPGASEPAGGTAAGQSPAPDTEHSGSASSERRLAVEKLHEKMVAIEQTLDGVWTGLLNVVLVVLFCVTPSVSRKIFSSWSCDSFVFDDATQEKRSYLRIDSSMRCSGDGFTSDDHDRLTSLSSGYVVLWPVLVPTVWLVLLLLSRRAIMSHVPTALSRSTKFLWADYEPRCCFWEVCELMRKISLTGFVLLVPNTRIVQRTLIGTSISIFYTTLLLAIGPYKEDVEDKAAVASAVLSSVMLATTLLMKLCDLSDDICSSLGFADTYQVSLSFVVTAMGILVVVAVAIAYKVFYAEKLHTVLLKTTRREPEMTLDRKLRWHGFVSHYWNSAQDLAALIKRQLTLLCPLTKIFLDVDDLQSIDELELYVEQSAVIFVIMSKGYFMSPNCMREVRHAVKQRKRIAPVHEGDPKHGGEPLSVLSMQCPDDLKQEIFETKGRVITPWHRVKDFQLVSLKSMVRELLLASPTYAKSSEAEIAIYVPGEVSLQKLGFSRGVRLAYSRYNPGAEAVAREIESTLRFIGAGSQMKEHVVAVPFEACKDATPHFSGGAKFLQSLQATRHSDTSSGEASARRDSSRRPPSPRKPAPRTLAKGTASTRSLARFGEDILVARENMTASTCVASTCLASMAQKATSSVELVPESGQVDGAIDVEAKISGNELAETHVEQTEDAPTHLLLYLNNQTFVGDVGRLLAAQVRKLLPAASHDLDVMRNTHHVKILLVHELDEAKGGCEFSNFFDTTPRDLIVDGIYKTLATGLAPGMHRAVSITLIAKSMGARKQSKRKGAGSVIQAIEADKKAAVMGMEKKKTARRTSMTVALDKIGFPLSNSRRSSLDPKSEKSVTSATSEAPAASSDVKSATEV